MKIAIPLWDGKLTLHFGHAEEFALVDIDAEKGEVRAIEKLQAPPHQPGLLPRWLGDKGANVIIAGGMGMRAQTLFAERGIGVVTGAAVGDPEEIAKAYLAGLLETCENICDH